MSNYWIKIQGYSRINYYLNSRNYIHPSRQNPNHMYYKLPNKLRRKQPNMKYKYVQQNILPFFNMISIFLSTWIFFWLRVFVMPLWKQFTISCTWRFESNFILPLEQKRLYTRRTLRSIRISRLAKIPTLYCDWLRSLN